MISSAFNPAVRRLITAVVGLTLGQGVLAQSLSNYAVRVSAEVQTNPPKIVLTWPADTNAASYTLYRKLRDDTLWDAGTDLAPDATNYVETNIVVGSAVEYHISKVGLTDGDGYIYAGIGMPLVESRGKVILVVESTQTVSLATELTRLQQDLVGEGWTVLRHDVPRMSVDPANISSGVWGARSNELANVKALIIADYNADPANVKAVFLIGHVPVPYSGDIYPDQHTDHQGAWPADAYYGDMNGSWPDATVNRTTASDPRNCNVPGDGKFDRSTIPSDVELQVGRVDFANLPAFALSETELLRRYLNKDHNFRHRLFTAGRRGLIDDGLGVSTSEPLAANGWRNFAPFFGASNSYAGDWLSTLATQSFLWGYGCGGGTYTSCSGVATTSQLAASDTRVVFSMLFGSYFGDWDSQNNLLRASIATTNYTLTSSWVGRPFWFFHHMALGETIGFSTRLAQNNDGYLYWGVGLNRVVHIGLMGDPTLRMHPVAPMANLVVIASGSSVDLSWNASPDPVVGYAVYRAADPAGPYTRLNPSLTTGTNYTVAGSASTNYMVRAVKLEVSSSGSYYNPSQGIFQNVAAAAGTPGIALAQPTNNARFLAPATIQLVASTFDPGNCITNVVFYANGLEVGQADLSSGSGYWSNAPAGTYSVSARATCSSGQVTNSSAVTVRVFGPPLLPEQADVTMVELITLSVTNTATDEAPASMLSYALTGPTNALIDPNGVITWTPTEAQGPVMYTLATVVTDNNVPTRRATNTFNVTVLESNRPPVLASIADRSVHAGNLVLVTNWATDPDIPTNTLTFSLDPMNAPAGAEINATSGVFTWAVSGADAHTTNHITVRVTDDGVPVLEDTQTLVLTVMAGLVIESIAVSNDLVTITWSAIAGQNYRLQHKGSIEAPDWEELSGEVIAGGPSASKSDAIGTSAKKFYRVVLLP